MSHRRPLGCLLQSALRGEQAVGSTRSFQACDRQATACTPSAHYGSTSPVAGRHLHFLPDPPRAGTGWSASTSLAGQGDAWPIPDRSRSFAALNRKAMTKGQKHNSAMSRMNYGAQGKFEQSATLISPQRLMGYWDAVVVIPPTWGAFFPWLWNNWRKWSLESIKATEAWKVLGDMYGKDAVQKELHDQFAQIYVKIKQQIAAGKATGTGSWQELVLPDPSKYISAEMAHRRNQGVTSITWLLAQPINIKNDVSIGQARLLNTSSEPGAPCWVQVVVQFNTREITAGYGADGQVLMGHPQDAVERSELWVMERSALPRGDPNWRLAARLLPTGGEVSAQVPDAQFQDQIDMMWESVKLAQKQTYMGWFLNNVLEPPSVVAKLRAARKELQSK